MIIWYLVIALRSGGVVIIPHPDLETCKSSMGQVLKNEDPRGIYCVLPREV